MKINGSITRWAPLVGIAALLAGCSGSPSSTTGTPAPSSPVAQTATPAATGAAKPAAAAGSDETQCPLTAQSLAAASSIEWTFGGSEPVRPLESNESIKARSCGWSPAGTKSTSLVLRSDTATGKNAAALTASFTDDCAGTVRPAGKGKICDVEGVTDIGIFTKDGAVTYLSLVYGNEVDPKYTKALEMIVAAAG